MKLIDQNLMAFDVPKLEQSWRLGVSAHKVIEYRYKKIEFPKTARAAGGRRPPNMRAFGRGSFEGWFTITGVQVERLNY